MITTSKKRFFIVGLVLVVFAITVANGDDPPPQVPVVNGVAYDAKSLIINGKRELLFSGSIHYPRSTPDMWPELIMKAKAGGLNVIQTYAFWNIHEPVKGQFDFTGPYDIVKFIKMVGDNGMFVTLRLGPFIQGEWNHGGLPYWLREVPGIIFRSDNEAWKAHMSKYILMILNMMKDNKLFAPQGGPIILGQIENEYSTVQLAYRGLGDTYMNWAGNLVVSQDIGIPWVMCKQVNTPDPLINSCNGRHCGDTFDGPNRPNKPSLWTENWTAQFRVFGDPPSARSSEDIAFSVARFVSKNGSLVNYYMYHGGTNFGRTAAHFVTTRYYDEGPLDEYGLEREPKYGHLRQLHRALSLSKKAILWGESSYDNLNVDTEARYYKQPGTKNCMAFLANNNTKSHSVINFKGKEYVLPPRSISILPDCKTVVYNTATIVAQHNSRNFRPSMVAKDLKFEMYSETIPTRLGLTSKEPLEIYSFTKDTTDYAWYTTTVQISAGDLPIKKEVLPILRVSSLGHALVCFVNGEYAGSSHGTHEEKSFVFQGPVRLKSGFNFITLLGIVTGYPDSGAYMEHRYAGPRGVSILGLNSGTRDLTDNEWGHQSGLEGEKLRLFTEEGAQKVTWKGVHEGKAPPVAWYKTYFDLPEGNNPVVVRMTNMSKGMIWVNGNNIGRYWMSFLSPLGHSTQEEYHIPRSYLKPTRNLMVFYDEEPGSNPQQVEIQLVDRDTICSFIPESAPPSVDAWQLTQGRMEPATPDVRLQASLQCPKDKVIGAVEFASFGNPVGICGGFVVGTCNAPASKEIVEKACLGKCSCSIPVDNKTFNNDINPCPEIPKALAVQVLCVQKKP